MSSNHLTINAELVTPESVLFSGQAYSVSAPGKEGDFCILPEHAPFVSELRSALVLIMLQNQTTRTFFVSGGICEVTNERCIILSEYAVDIDDCSLKDVNEQLSILKKQYDRLTKGPKKDRVYKRLLTIQALQESI